jgi:TRAP-type C4-dicarboxylate transport system permease small subunit
MLSEILTRVGVPAIFSDTFTLTGLMMVGVTYLALSSLQKEDGNIKMTLFISKLKPKNALKVKLAYNLLEIIVLVIIVWQTTLGTIRAFELGDTTMAPGLYLTWPIRALIPIGLGVYCIRLILESINKIILSINQDKISADKAPLPSIE